MGLFDYFGRESSYSYSYTMREPLYSHLTPEFSLESGVSSAHHFVLAITKKPLTNWFGYEETIDVSYEVYKTFGEIQEAMKQHTLNTWHDNPKIIGFQVDAVGRELTNHEKEMINEYKLKCLEIHKNNQDEVRQKEINELERKLNHLKSK